MPTSSGGQHVSKRLEVGGFGWPTSRVPCGQKVDTAGEETGLENTENGAHGGEVGKVAGETHADHDGAPGEGDARKMDPRSDLANNDCAGRLEDDVGDEEDEGDDVLGEGR